VDLHVQGAAAGEDRWSPLLRTRSGVLLPESTFIRAGVGESLVASVVRELVGGALPPLTTRDVLFLTHGAVALSLSTQWAKAGRRLDMPLARVCVTEATSMVAAVADPLVRAAGFDAGALRAAFRVLNGTFRRHVARIVRIGIEKGDLAPRDARRRFRDTCRSLETQTMREFHRWSAAATDWHALSRVPAQTVAGRKDDRLAAIFEWEGRLAARFLGPHVVSPNQAQAELVRALKKKAPRILREVDERGNPRTARDLLHEAIFEVAKQVPDLGEYFRGEDGKWHRNSNRDADRLRERRRQRGACVSIDGSPVEQVDPGPDVVDAVAAVEQQREIRRALAAAAAACLSRARQGTARWHVLRNAEALFLGALTQEALAKETGLSRSAICEAWSIEEARLRARLGRFGR